MNSTKALPATPPRKTSLNNRVVLTALIGLVTLLALSQIADQYAHDQLNQSMVAAGFSFATARALDAGISLLQSVGFSVGFELNVGAVLSPLNDLIEKFCTVMTLALGSLALQKILITILSSKIANALVCISAAALTITLWNKKAARYFSPTFSVFKAVVLVRFLLLCTVALNLTVDTIFLEEQTQASSAQIVQVAKTVDFLTDEARENTAEDSDDKGYLASMKESWNQVTNSIENQKQKIINIREDVEASITGFVNLMVLFILKTVIFPLLFLFGLKGLFVRGIRV